MMLWCRHEWETKVESTVEPPLLKAIERLIDAGEISRSLGVEEPAPGEWRDLHERCDDAWESFLSKVRERGGFVLVD